MGKRLLEQAKIANAQIGFQTVFNNALDVQDEPIRQLAMTVQSSGSQEDYNWLGDVPGMEEWIDDRAMGKLRAEKYSLSNRDWANGLEVDRNDILDDKLGMVRPRIQMLANKARLHPGKLLADLLVNGFDGTVVSWSDGLAYDGKFFFATNHVDGDGPTQSNKGTAALAFDSFDTAMTAMMSLTDEDSYPLDINPSHLVCGPSLRRTALEILKSGLRVATSGDGAIENVEAGSLDLIISKRLVGSYANYWFLVDLTQPVRPLIFQDRKAITFSALDSPTSDEVFMRKRLKYGADGRYAVGYGLWQMAWGSDGTT